MIFKKEIEPKNKESDLIAIKRDVHRSEIRKEGIKKLIEKKRYLINNEPKIDISDIPEIKNIFQELKLEKWETSKFILNLNVYIEEIEKINNDKFLLDFLIIIRKITCTSDNNILTDILKKETIDFLQKILFKNINEIIYEILWILVNLTSLPLEIIRKSNINFMNILMILIEKSKSEIDDNLLELELWILINISSGDYEMKKTIVSFDIINIIERVYKNKSIMAKSFFLNIKLMSILTNENKMDENYYEQMKKLLPLLDQELNEKNIFSNPMLTDYEIELFSSILGCLSEICSNQNERIRYFLNNIKIEKILPFLDIKENTLVISALQIFKYILSGDNDLIKMLLENNNLLDYLFNLSNNSLRGVRKTVFFCLSNICCSSYSNIELVFKHKIMNQMINLGLLDEFMVKKEICIALANFTVLASKEHIYNLVGRGMVDIWADTLENYENLDIQLIVYILTGLEIILKNGKEIEGLYNKNYPLDIVIKTKLPSILAEIQYHSNETISNKAYKIMDEYFPHINNYE